MSRAKGLSDEEEKFIFENYVSMGAIAIAQRLNRANTTIYAFMDKHGLDPLKVSNNGPKHRTDRSIEDRHGNFNVHARQNWLI